MEVNRDIKHPLKPLKMDTERPVFLLTLIVLKISAVTIDIMYNVNNASFVTIS